MAGLDTLIAIKEIRITLYKDLRRTLATGKLGDLDVKLEGMISTEIASLDALIETREAGEVLAALSL